MSHHQLSLSGPIPTLFKKVLIDKRVLSSVVSMGPFPGSFMSYVRLDSVLRVLVHRRGVGEAAQQPTPPGTPWRERVGCLPRTLGSL